MKEILIDNLSYLERIKLIRLKKGFSQEFMAYKLGVSQKTYSNIENGRTSINDEKKKAFLGLTICLFFIFSIAFIETHSTAQVAWGVHELTSSEAAAGVTGTGVAIGASQAIATAIRGASWGARIGAYAGPIGLVGGALIGGL